MKKLWMLLLLALMLRVNTCTPIAWAGAYTLPLYNSQNARAGMSAGQSTNYDLNQLISGSFEMDPLLGTATHYSLAGDIGCQLTNSCKVTGLQGVPVSSATPAAGECLVDNSVTGWTPEACPQVSAPGGLTANLNGNGYSLLGAGLSTFNGVSGSGQTNGSDSISELNWNDVVDPRTFGAKFDYQTASGATVTANGCSSGSDELSGPTFASADVGKYVKVETSTGTPEFTGTITSVAGHACLSGNVTGGTQSSMFVAWATDDSAAIIATLQSFGSNMQSGTLELPNRPFGIANTLTIYGRSVRVEGQGWGTPNGAASNGSGGASVFWFGGTGPMVRFYDSVGSTLDGVSLFGNSESGHEPSAAIAFCNDAGQPGAKSINSFNMVENVSINGGGGWDADKDSGQLTNYGVEWEGAGDGGGVANCQSTNDDRNMLQNVRVSDVTTCFYNHNNQVSATIRDTTCIDSTTNIDWGVGGVLDAEGLTEVLDTGLFLRASNSAHIRISDAEGENDYGTPGLGGEFFQENGGGNGGINLDVEKGSSAYCLADMPAATIPLAWMAIDAPPGDSSTTTYNMNLTPLAAAIPYFETNMTSGMDPIVPGTVSITNGTITATDNGSGGLTGSGITSGSINYTTLAASITLSSASKAPVGSAWVAEYSVTGPYLAQIIQDASSVITLKNFFFAGTSDSLCAKANYEPVFQFRNLNSTTPYTHSLQLINTNPQGIIFDVSSGSDPSTPVENSFDVLPTSDPGNLVYAAHEILTGTTPIQSNRSDFANLTTHSLTISPVATPPYVFQNSCVGGATAEDYYYSITAAVAGRQSLPYSTFGPIPCAAALSSSNYVQFRWEISPGADSYEIYRCSVTHGGSACTPTLYDIIDAGRANSTEVPAYVDTGVGIAQGSALPTVNATGVSIAAYRQDTPMTEAQAAALCTAGLGTWFALSDSTSISSEGQACAGSSSNAAAAFCAGGTLKCF